ncbi:MAG: DUF111 family protein, partial [Gemmatimonadota bacterium]|nr:DUF111 family protein [Gemmatimonadota bacterium]
GSGELTTPTGAVLLQTLATRGIPASYRPVKSGYGAGTKDFVGRANALRVVLADVDEAGPREPVALLACDVDDMEGEYLAAAVDAVRAAGALDASILSIVMKKGRPGARIEVLCHPEDAQRLEALLFSQTTTIGVRRSLVSRSVLSRVSKTVSVFGHDVAIKVATLPDGSTRMKPEFDDVVRVAAATQKGVAEVRNEAIRLA